jgi:branched-chain amino acid aminotransferase
MSDTIYFVGDKYVNKENAFIHVNDIGLLRGYAVFDYLKTYFGKPFHLSDHLERLQNSAQYIGLSIPYSNEEIKKICYELLSKNNFPESNIRIVVTGGVGTDSKTKGNSELIVTCEPRIVMNPEFYTKGIKIKTVEGSREIFLSKTCNYIRAIDYLDEYRKLGYSEVLYVLFKKVLECTSSNVFLIKYDTIITPDTGVLMGITRKVIFEICSKFMNIELREVELGELLNADEVFISSTEREIMPVIMIDDKEVSGGKVGEKTKRIHKEFIDYVNSMVWAGKSV